MSKTILTAAFATYQAQCSAADHPVILDEFVFALIPHQDPNAPIHPEETLPTNEMIKGRFKITQKGMINPDAVVYSIILGTEIGSWDFNWIGLVNSDTNLVAAITHTTPQTKVKADPSNNIEGDTLTRNIITSYVNAAELTDINVTADVWQLDFNQRLMAMDDRVRLENIDTYGVSSFIGDAWLVTPENEGAVIHSGTGYVQGLQCINPQRIPLDINAVSFPQTVYLDVSFDGSVNSEWHTKTRIVITNHYPDKQIEKGITHYSVPLATINSLSDITDLRTPDWRTYHLNEKNDPHPQYAQKSDIDTYVSLTSTNKAGLIELATQEEVNTGIDSQKAVTPATLKPVIDDTKNYASEQARQEANRVKSEIYGGIPATTLDTIAEVAEALTETGDAVATLFKQLGEKLPTTVFDAFKKTVTDNLNNKLGKTEKAVDSSKLDGLGATAFLRDNGWNTSPGQDANTQPNMSTDFSYANNAPYTGPITRIGAGDYSLQLSNGYSSGNTRRLSFRSKNGDSRSWNPWTGIMTGEVAFNGMSTSGQWHKLAIVTMPNSASTAVIEINNGVGFNVGSEGQVGTQKIYLRTGNGTPATGLTIMSISDGGLSLIVADMGYRAIGNNQYEIYALAGQYPDAGLAWRAWTSLNAEFKWVGNAVGTAQPTGLTKWLGTTITYNSRYKQTGVLSGTIWHGDTIPIPSGFSRSQCHYIVSLNDSGTGTWDVDENGNYNHYRTRCSVNQSTGVVTALRDVVFHGRGNIETGCATNYMVIATR